LAGAPGATALRTSFLRTGPYDATFNKDAEGRRCVELELLLLLRSFLFPFSHFLPS
jgi:hypothetical protein